MPQLVTADELMRTIDLGGDNPARIDPNVLNDILNQVEDYVQTYTKRRFAPEPALVDGADTGSPVTKTFKVARTGHNSLSSRNSVRVRIPDLREATAVILDGNALTENIDYILDPYAGDEPFTHLKIVNWNSWINPWTLLQQVSTLEITGRWGFSPPPEAIKGVVRYLAARLYRRRDAMYADAVDTGTGVFDYRSGMPDDMQRALDLYKIPQIAVVGGASGRPL